MNVVPRSTMNTIGGTENNSEVGFKVLSEPMNNPLVVSPSKGNQGTIRATFSVRPRSSVGKVAVDLIWRSVVRFPPRSKDFSLPWRVKLQFLVVLRGVKKKPNPKKLE